MKLPLLFACTLLPLASCASTSSGDGSTLRVAGAPSETTLAQFENLKSLEGDWYFPNDAGQPDGDVAITYRVSSGGSAVIETSFPGSPMEMTTVFGLDQDQLVLSHYCAIGNAPRMLAVDGGDANDVLFECTGVGNVASHDEQHMHRAHFTFEGDDVLHSVWTMFVDGEIGESHGFGLVLGPS